MPGITSKSYLKILWFVSGIILGFIVWNILGFLDTPFLQRLFWTALTFFGGSSGLVLLVGYLAYEYHLYKDRKNTLVNQKEIPATRGQTVLEAEHRGLTKFHLEDIRNLHRLTKINLGLNQLKAIDLSPLAGSTNLKELILYMNNLEAIDLSPLASCPNLEYLDLTDNDLESIDLAPLASCTKLDALNIGINKTSEIDLSPLSECWDLKILTIDGMGLREVELSPLKNCTKLEFLKLDDNTLISLDVTPLFECKSLTDFPIDKIELTTTLSYPIEDWPIGVRKHAKRFRRS